MSKKTMYGIVALSTLVLLAVGSITAFGFGKGAMMGLSDEDQEEREAFKAQLETAIENEDYEAWVDLMESQLTTEQFELIVERHEKMQEMDQIREQMRQAKEDGDTETFEELRNQLRELMPEDAPLGSRGMGMKGHGMMGQGFANGECPFAESSE